MAIEIKHRQTGEVLYTVDADTLVGADLRKVDLSYADLSGRDLRRADLSGAKIHFADFSGSDLSDARMLRISGQSPVMQCANLSRAGMYAADLPGVRTDRANLTGASLIRANLTDARMQGATLVGTRLDRADLACASLKYAILADGYEVTQFNLFHHITNLGFSEYPLEVYLCRAGWYVRHGFWFAGPAEKYPFCDTCWGTQANIAKARRVVATLCT